MMQMLKNKVIKIEDAWVARMLKPLKYVHKMIVNKRSSVRMMIWFL